MKQFNIIFFLTIFISMVGTKVSAYDFEVDGIYYNVLSFEDLTCEIAPRWSYESNYSGDFTIPNEVQYKGRKLKVIQLGNYAFAKSSVTSVTIPAGIISIGDRSFSDCRKLESIQIPNTVTSIGSFSFWGCRSLVSISLPASVNTIGDNAFQYSHLIQITIPDGVPAIKEEMFSGCSALANVSIPLSVTTIESSAFKGCSSLITITLPKGLRKIGESAFRDCSALKSINIPASCEEIRNYAFNGCVKLKKLVIEDGSTPLLLGFCYVRNDNAKYYQDLFDSGYDSKNEEAKVRLDTLYLGRIAKRALEWLPSQGAGFRQNIDWGFFGTFLESITIGNMVTDEIFESDERYLFHEEEQYYHGCQCYRKRTPDYSHITFGESITSVPDMSFNYLDSIVVFSNTPPTAVAFSNKTYLDGKLYVPKGCKATYQSADVWKNFWNIIELEQDSGTLDIKTYYGKEKNSQDSRYTLDGQLISQPRKGLNIIKMSDGSTRKVIVK